MTKRSAEAGQDASVAAVVFVCTDVPAPGTFLHRLLLEKRNRLESASPTSHVGTRVKFIIVFAVLFQDNRDVNV